MQHPAISSSEELPAIPAKVSLVDSHCHLETDAFEHDREKVVAQAKAAQVERMITIGASGAFEANHVAIRVAREHDGVFATVGIHPHDASTLSEGKLEQLEALAADSCVVGIGESGLDYHYDHSPREQQRNAFRRFIDLAKRTNLALSVHLRNADADAAEILRSEGLGAAGGVIHCFSSTPDAARTFLDLGMHISFSGILTFKSAAEVREAAKFVPQDRLLVETDAPFLAPIPHRGRRNEPALLVYTALKLAEIRGESLESLATATARNTDRLFGLTQRRD